MSSPTPSPDGATDAERGLEPCSRCGGKAFVTVHFEVWCELDRCLKLPARESRDEAIAAWNTRPAPAGDDITSAGEVERLRKLCERATLGPWKGDNNVDDDLFAIYPDTDKMAFPIAIMPAYIKPEVNAANAALILAAVAYVRSLVATPISAGLAPVSDEVVERVRQQVINTPETADFMAAVPLEAAHQRDRWGSEHDAGKTPFDWFWLVGYLAQKAASSAVAGDTDKALHHTISTAAALANWHAALSGKSNAMRPGIEPPAALSFLTQPQPSAGEEITPAEAKSWWQAVTFDEAAADCERAAEETKFASEISEEQIKGYRSACSLIAASLRVKASRATRGLAPDSVLRFGKVRDALAAAPRQQGEQS